MVPPLPPELAKLRVSFERRFNIFVFIMHMLAVVIYVRIYFIIADIRE